MRALMRALKSSTSHAALGAAVGFALIAGVSAASAQTMISSQPVGTQTVTTETRTVRTLPAHTVRRQVITTRTVTQRVVPAPGTVIGRSVATYPQPIYDEVTSGPAVVATSPYSRPLYDSAYSRPLYDSAYSRPLYDSAYSRPLYDEVATTPPATAIDNGSILATQPYIYHYVYEPDRILVIDPASGTAIQAIPR
jgi:hypothetical protein